MKQKPKNLSTRCLSLILSVLMIVSVMPFSGIIEAQAATKIATLLWPVHDKDSGAALKGINTHHGTHHGIDINAAKGQKWYAAYDGTIEAVYTGCKTNGNGNHRTSCSPNVNYWYSSDYGKEFCNNGFGNGIIIKSTISGTAYYMHYAHMDAVASGLKKGQSVKKGTYLGTVGDRGCSFGAHAHFEVDKEKLWSNYCDNDPSHDACIFNYDYSPITTNVTITFNGNGADSVSTSSVTVTSGNSMSGNTPTAVRDGYVFDGWYTAASGGTFISSGTGMTKSQTLYAHWVKSDATALKVGSIYRIKSVKSVDENTPRYLQTNGSGAGARITLRDYSESTAQLWRVASVDANGFYTFESLYGGNNMDLDTSAETRWNNQNALQLWTPSDHNAQKFGLVKRSKGYSIHNAHSGRGLDCAGNTVAVGTQIQSYYYVGGTQQQFYFEEQTNRNTVFYDNADNSYLPTIKNVYNRSGATPVDCYQSRDTAYLTTSVSEDTLTINNKARTDGNVSSMTWATSVNGSYNYDVYNADTDTYTLYFKARASVDDVKMTFRWGYDATSGDSIRTVTIGTEWKSYTVYMPRTKLSGSNLHPWVDKASTVYIKDIRLLDETFTSLPADENYYSGIQELTYNSTQGTYGTLPSPKNLRSGYKFDGWYTKRVGGTKLTESTAIKYNQRYYAHWSECAHNYVKEVEKEAGCLSVGRMKYTCSECGDTYYETEPALGHVWSNWTVTVPATSTQAGEEARECTRCGYTETATISPVEHIHSAAAAVIENNVPATCTENGSYDEVVYCSECDEELSRSSKIVGAKGHTSVTDAAVPASCTQAGKTEGSHCSVCGAIIRQQQTVAAKGHSWGEWSTVRAATETQEGQERRECTVCTAAETRSTPILTHTHTNGAPVEENRIEPTCTQDGSYDEVVYCSSCNIELSRTKKTISSPGHTTVKDKAVVPTCTLPGKTEGSHCSVCGEVITAQTTIAPLNHSYYESYVAPKCTEPGYTTYICTRCNDTYKGNFTSALGHNYGDWVTVTSATETQQGEEKHWCTRCGNAESRKTSVLVHIHENAEPIKENIIEATCTENGSYDEVVYCSKCGALISREKKLTAAKGHTVVSDPSVDSTCTETGLTAGTHCSTCGKILTSQRETPMLDHIYTMSVLAQPTCTSEGVKQYICVLCDDSYIEYIPKAAHSVVKDSAIPATCTSEGKTEGSRCAVCGEIIKAQITVKATGHKPVTDAAVPATYIAEGKTEGSHCSVCGQVLTPQKTIAKLKVPPTVIKKTVAKKKSFKLSWKKIKGISGYQIQYSTSSNFSKSKKVFVKNSTTHAKTIKKLKVNKTYYIRIRTYVKVNGKNVYSKWSSKKKIVTK